MDTAGNVQLLLQPQRKTLRGELLRPMEEETLLGKVCFQKLQQPLRRLRLTDLTHSLHLLPD